MIKTRSMETQNAFTLLELMIITAILAILLAIAISNFIHMRHKAYCTQAEQDADHVAAAIADYFGVPVRTQLPLLNDLNLAIVNPVEIVGDPNTLITIRVTDRTSRCPLDYQSAHAQWDSNYVFTKTIE